MCVVRTAEETEEYQRVTTNVGKGLAVIQEELHRMRIATKAQVESIAIKNEVRSLVDNRLPVYVTVYLFLHIYYDTDTRTHSFLMICTV